MIFSIGYSTRTLPEFLHELHRRGITRLVDLRSSPWSRNAPFVAWNIERWAERAGIMYSQRGDVLGGRSEIATDHPRYIAALEKLVAASCRERLVLMCSEGDPAQCHRTYDVGAALFIRYGLIVQNILRDGREEDVKTTLARVSPDRCRPEIRCKLGAQPDLFSGN